MKYQGRRIDGQREDWKKRAVGARSLSAQGRCPQNVRCPWQSWLLQGRVCAWCTRASPGTQHLPGTFWGLLQPQPLLGNLAPLWLSGDRLSWDFFFFPCFLSFSSPFFARAGFMSHVKNILIPGYYWLTMKKPRRDSQCTPSNNVSE